MNPEILSDDSLSDLILYLVRRIEETNPDGRDWIDLDDPVFDSLPCSRFRVYRVARNMCHKWGYEYQPASCRNKSGSTKPALIKVKS